MGGKAEEEAEYRLECPWINKVQGCYNRTQERALLSSGECYIKQGGGRDTEEGGGCEHQGSNVHLHLTVFFEDL